MGPLGVALAGPETPEVAERWNSGMGPLNTAIATSRGLEAQVRQNDGHRGMSRNSKPHLGQQFKQNSYSIKNFTICLIQNSNDTKGHHSNRTRDKFHNKYFYLRL